MITLISTHARRERSGEYPALPFAAEQAGRHGRAWNNRLWMDQPAVRPCRAQTVFSQQEIRSGRISIMPRISRGMTLETGRRRTGEQLAGHSGFRRKQRL